MGDRAVPETRRGGALLAVLWLSAALATIAFSLASTVRGEVERASTAVDGTRAYYLAEGAIHRTILHMLWFRDNPNLPPPYRPASRAADSFQFPGGEARVEIIPETARLNINTAPPERIFRLLLNLGVEPARAQEIAAAILDWRSPAPGDGASQFDQFYLSRNPSFRPRHASLEETEELLLVKGMTPDIYYGAWQHAAEGGTGGAAAPGPPCGPGRLRLRFRRHGPLRRQYRTPRVAGRRRGAAGCHRRPARAAARTALPGRRRPVALLPE